MLTKHFSKKEFACKCRRAECDAKPMSKVFMQKLETLRLDWGIPLVPTSGARCAYWNEKKDGSPKSQHLLGNAADFWFDNTSDLLAFVELAEKHGFGGVGAGSNLVHVDNRKNFARWTYDDK
jgi:uncharacterized protein YcbK (DUF882 family)